MAAAVMALALALPAPLWAQDEAALEPESPAAATTPAPPAADPSATAQAEPEQPPAPPAEAPATPEPAPATAPEPAYVAPPPAPTPARQGGVTVSMVDYAFEPSAIEITVGGSVTWVNNGPDEPHTATAGDGSFDTGELAVGASSTVSFDQAGSFSYLCSLHPGMTGTVAVLAAADNAPRDDGTGADGTTTDPGVAPTEAAAVASPTAAGTANSLPATGSETGLLAAAGLALVACGAQLLLAQRYGRRCSAR